MSFGPRPSDRSSRWSNRPTGISGCVPSSVSASATGAFACARRTGITRSGSRIISCHRFCGISKHGRSGPSSSTSRCCEEQRGKRDIAAGRRSAAPAPLSAPARPRRTGAGAEPGHALHVRQVRRRSDQPVRARRRAHGRRGARVALESALHLRRRRPRQDPPAAGDRPRDPPPAPRLGDHLRHLRGLRHRLHRVDDESEAPERDESDGGVPHALPGVPGRAAGRRHPVPVEQGQLAGRVLPHLQRAPLRAQADRADLRQAAGRAARASRTGCAAASPGASSARSRCPTSRRASRS